LCFREALEVEVGEIIEEFGAVETACLPGAAPAQCTNQFLQQTNYIAALLRIP